MQHPVGDHALLADGRTAALVDPAGNIAWLCWPRVDSPPCLLSILDDVDGGVFEVAPLDPHATVVERGYVPGTLILRTVWRADGGELVVHDALACDGELRLVRTLRAIGAVEVGARVALAPDAARARAEMSMEGRVTRIRGGGIDVAVHAPAPWMGHPDGSAICHFRVESAEQAVVLCDAGASAVPLSMDGTIRWFTDRTGAARGAVPTPMAERALGAGRVGLLVEQSAAVLAGLHQRGGGIVAAPTTSIPQWPGSSRTWDYRYSWLRDSALAGLAMVRCGLLEDASGLGDFIGAATSALPPPVLLRVDGSRPPPEAVMDHLRGYGGARPVRIGNAAADQPQLDVAGEVLELAAELAAHDVLPASLRAGVVRVADWTSEHWGQPDHGIWEIRGAPRRYTHSRVMAWSGLVRAAGMARRGAVDGDAGRWQRAADRVREAVLGGGGALSLTDEGGGPDAALAQAATVGFLECADPRLRDTLDSITTGLDRGGLIDRHVPEEDVSDAPCGPFLFATFWLAQALERCGRDGTRHFAAAAAARGSLGLFGEVADPRDGSPLGNYPQVQSHAAFVLSAVEKGPGDVI